MTPRPIWITEVGASSFGAEEVQDFGLRRSAESLLGRAEQRLEQARQTARDRMV